MWIWPAEWNGSETLVLPFEYSLTQHVRYFYVMLCRWYCRYFVSTLGFKLIWISTSRIHHCFIIIIIVIIIIIYFIFTFRYGPCCGGEIPYQVPWKVLPILWAGAKEDKHILLWLVMLILEYLVLHTQWLQEEVSPVQFRGRGRDYECSFEVIYCVLPM